MVVIYLLIGKKPVRSETLYIFNVFHLKSAKTHQGSWPSKILIILKVYTAYSKAVAEQLSWGTKIFQCLIRPNLGFVD